MAKKVAVPDEAVVEAKGGIKAKRKHHCCCTCCLVVLIITLVIFLAAFIVGWILGDKYTKKLFGLSMGDTLGVVGDLYWTKDKDVVTRPYSQSDLDGFYSEIKRNILLKDSADVDFDGALQAAINKYLGVEAKAQTLNASEDGESDSEITDIFVDMIVGVLDRDHIDIERLNKYDANDPHSDEYIFNLHDKQLAAFINSVLTSVLKNADKMESLKDASEMVRVDSIVALKQIIFTAREETGDNGAKTVKASSADITVWLGLQDAANQAIKWFLNDLGQGWAGGVVGWLGNVILPKNLYLTISVPLYGEDNAASIRINDMDESERARANTLINGIIKQVNGEDSKTLDEVIDDFVGEIRPMLEQATEKMVFDNANDGYLSMDLLDTVAKMASEDMEGEGLSKADFLYVLQTLLSEPTAQLNALIPYRYDNWYLVDGAEKFLEDGSDSAVRIDYQERFIEEIERKYAIDFGEDKDLKSVLGMLGISLDGSESNMGSTDLLDKMDSEAFAELLDVPNTQNIKLNITDRMLGATFADQMKDKLKDNSDFSDLNVTLRALTFIDKPDRAGRQYAKLAVNVDLKDMLASMTGDGDSLIYKLVNGLMPDDILLTVTVDVSRNISKAERDKAEFIINSAWNTDRAISAMEKLVPDIDLNGISDQISDMLNDMLDEIEKNVQIELISSTYEFKDNVWLGSGAGASIVMPDIFTIITDMVLVEENPDGTTTKIVQPDELKAVIRDLNNPAEIEATQPAGYKDFIDQVFLKYYLEDPETPVEDFDALTAYMNDFETDMLRVDGNDGLAHDTTAMAELCPTMNETELLALLNDKMEGNDTIESYNIVKVEIGDNTLAVTLSIALSDLMTGAEQVQKLISADEMYATATFLTDTRTGAGTDDDPYGYEVSLSVNVKKQGENDVMDGDTYGAMLDIVNFFDDGFDIETQVKEFGVILYEQMANLNESIGGSEDRQMFTFTARGLELTDFYTFLALKMEPSLIDDGYTNEQIRKTVQGLYDYDEDAPNDNNFKVNEIMFNPPSEMGSRKWPEEETETLYGKTHVDVDFNGFLKQGVEIISEAGSVAVEQTMILTEGDNRKSVQDVRDWLNRKLALYDEDSVNINYNYLAITFSMLMDDYVGEDDGEEGEKNDAKALFPERIRATVVYKYEKDEEGGKDFTVVGGIGEDAPVLVFNNMDKVQYEIMVRLMGANPDSGATDENKVNMKSIAMRGEDVLNSMSHYEYKLENGGKVELETEIIFSATTTDETGMGKIYISKPSPHVDMFAVRP